MNEIYLYGEIYPGQIDERYVQSILNSYNDNNLTVYINSPGGHVFTGLAIYNLLSTRRPTFKIIGQASSIASVIACSGRVKIARSAMMLIHNPWSFAIGDEKYHKRISNELNKIKDVIINAYIDKTGLSREKIIEIMDSGTLMTADECLELGFADEIIEPNEKEISSLYKHSALAISNNNKSLLDRLFKNQDFNYDIIIPENRGDIDDLIAENRQLKSELEKYEFLAIEVECEKFITNYQDRIYPNEKEFIRDNLISFRANGNDEKFAQCCEMIASRLPFAGLNQNINTQQYAYPNEFKRDTMNNDMIYESVKKFADENEISFSEALSKLARQKF